MEKLSEFLDIVVNKPFSRDEACTNIVNITGEGNCPFQYNRKIDCPNCIFDKRGKRAVAKANKILITLKE
jgi:hypothetical protein